MHYAGYMGEECLNDRKIYLPHYEQSIIVEPSKILIMAAHAMSNPCFCKEVKETTIQ